MLTKGQIPSSEPLLRVGITLPEDQQGSITILFPASEFYHVSPSSFSTCGSSLTVSVRDGELTIGDLGVHKVEIRRSPTAPELEKPMIVKNVIAGRSFHWKKAIDVSLLGDLEIRVVDGKILAINELPLEQYLMCVATSEMSAQCPIALIESQTIVARSWMLANVEQKHRQLGFDVCNDDCCQRYHGTGNLTPQSIQGAVSTRGQVIMFDEQICDARYSKSCGGMMERFEVLWEGDPLPYMQNIFDGSDDLDWHEVDLSKETNLEKWVQASPGTFCSPQVVPEEELKKYIGGVDEEGQYFRWKFEYLQSELTDLLNDKLELEAQYILAIKPLHRGGSGRMNKMQIIYRNNHGIDQTVEVNSEYRIRQVMHPSFLYSSAFYVETAGAAELPDKFTLNGAGWGHGAGLCQIGALGMALKGYRTDTILKHYYPGSRLVNLYP